MSKEPIINEENIAIENAVRKAQRTIEDYVVSRLEALERISQQQHTIIKSQEEEIQKYEYLVELLKNYAEVGSSGYIAIRIFVDRDAKKIIELLGLKKGNENE